jgi:hypothetical protein
MKARDVRCLCGAPLADVAPDYELHPRDEEAFVIAGTSWIFCHCTAGHEVTLCPGTDERWRDVVRVYSMAEGAAEQDRLAKEGER